MLPLACNTAQYPPTLHDIAATEVNRNGFGLKTTGPSNFFTEDKNYSDKKTQ
jgi:hypothetical protein